MAIYYLVQNKSPVIFVKNPLISHVFFSHFLNIWYRKTFFYAKYYLVQNKSPVVFVIFHPNGEENPRKTGDR